MAPLSRSENMARIRGKDTTPELILRRALWKQGVRYRLNRRVSGVRPDLVFPTARTAVFVDGCFWHGCPLHYTRPRAGNSDFWADKLRENTSRDDAQNRSLHADGWTVVRVWEHELVPAGLEAVVERIAAAVRNPRAMPESHWVVVEVVPVPDNGAAELFRLKELHSGRVDFELHARAPVRGR